MFKDISLGLVRQYANSVADPKVNDVEILLAAKQFATCYDYYMKEHAIAKDMLKEYRTYVFSGHILDQFLLTDIDLITNALTTGNFHGNGFKKRLHRNTNTL
jgi:hypothetical protein